MWNTRLRTAPITETRVHMDDRDASVQLQRSILDHIEAHAPHPSPITVVCIGSDRSTGDALGPLVGTRLAKRVRHTGVDVKGTLERPVHAANLTENLERINSFGQPRTIIAIDACLGRTENVGTACVKSGPLKPGTGVNKSLPSIGHFHIVGVVNVGGFMEYFVLQNTRLNLVVRLADIIADATALALERYFGKEATQVAATKEV